MDARTHAAEAGEEAPAGAPSPETRRWTRVDRVACAVVVVAIGVTLAWTVHPWFDKANDASLYLLTARSLWAGEGFTYLGEPFVVRPPGWSAVLAPLVGAEPPPDFGLLNRVGALFGALTALATFWLTRPRLSGPLAAVLALAIWWNPGLQRLSTQPLSDVPGLALVLVALVLERTARERGGLAWHLALGLGLTLAVYVRSFALLLLPAILCGRLFGARASAEAREAREAGAPRASARGLALALALPLVAFAPWIVRNAGAEVTTPTEQVFLRSYGTAMTRVDAGDPSSERISLADFAERTRDQTGKVLATLDRRLTEAEQPGTGPLVWAWVLLAGTLVAWVRRRDATTWTALAATVVLCTYFAFKPRLVLPLYVLTTVLATEAFSALGPARLRAVLRLVVGVVLAVVAWLDFDPWSWHDEVQKDHDAYRRVTTKLVQELGPDVTLASFFGWHLGVWLPNPVYSLSIVASREGPEASLRLLEQHDVAALVFHRKSDPGDMYTNALAALGRRATQIGNFRVIRTEGFRVSGGTGSVGQ